MHGDASGWSEPTLEALRVPQTVMPEIVDSSGLTGEAIRWQV